MLQLQSKWTAISKLLRVDKQERFVLSLSLGGNSQADNMEGCNWHSGLCYASQGKLLTGRQQCMPVVLCHAEFLLFHC